MSYDMIWWDMMTLSIMLVVSHELGIDFEHHLKQKSVRDKYPQ